MAWAIFGQAPAMDALNAFRMATEGVNSAISGAEWPNAWIAMIKILVMRRKS
jgi:hypothetical protein